jgi:hypothetical protein
MSKYIAAGKTAVLVFLATIVGLIITNGAGILEMTHWSDWKPYVAAGIAAVVALAYNFLNPWDKRYGVGSE